MRVIDENSQRIVFLQPKKHGKLGVSVHRAHSNGRVPIAKKLLSPHKPDS